ncbi:hypothetical protein GIB67_001708 [Kingdonia uniflora]|uniref:Vesicle transport protein n=1 Tax=Kingdonia uniflora TaxID=39325 RepID=A0A7J7LN49_9MAGN|nr:hypothetical protein GIB67_001708 [Kingdonia uniflora]
MEKMNQALEKVKMFVGMEVDEEDEELATISEESSFLFMDDFNRQCTLSTKQDCRIPLKLEKDPVTVPSKRLYGFAICFVAGLACTLLSLFVFFNPIKFGVAFTFGNLLSIGSWSFLYGSTAFLIGPKRQVTMMLDPARIYATAMFVASIIVALFCALYIHNKLLTLLVIVLEFGALIW